MSTNPTDDTQAQGSGVTTKQTSGTEQTSGNVATHPRDNAYTQVRDNADRRIRATEAVVAARPAISIPLDQGQGDDPAEGIGSARDVLMMGFLRSDQDFQALIEDPHATIQALCKNRCHELDCAYESLFGRDYTVLTLQFVYPVGVTDQNVDVVEFIYGTNVIMVRKTSAGSELADKDFGQGKLDINLLEDSPGSNQGIAYCHHHLAQGEREAAFQAILNNAHHDPARRKSVLATYMEAVTNQVANIISNPKDYCKSLNEKFTPGIQRVDPETGRLQNPSASKEMKANFTLKEMVRPDQSSGQAASEQQANAEKPVPEIELRFIYQRHLECGGGGKSAFRTFAPAKLLPCVKPAGRFRKVGNEVQIALDTIIVVDYAA